MAPKDTRARPQKRNIADLPNASRDTEQQHRPPLNKGKGKTENSDKPNDKPRKVAADENKSTG